MKKPLDDQPPVEAYEIDGIVQQRNLAPELETLKPASAQGLPESIFDIGPVRSKLPRERTLFGCHDEDPPFLSKSRPSSGV